MKKTLSTKLLALVLTLSMVFAMSTSFTAFAAEADNSEDTGVEIFLPASVTSHVSYYPSSGASSGYFSGQNSSEAIYNSLPAGIMKFAYSMSGGTTCYLRFYYKNQNSYAVQSNALNANNNTDISSVVLPFSGKYRVSVYFPNGNQNTTLIYAFNLFTE